jgi:uncharacterized protein (DUF433 family)
MEKLTRITFDPNVMGGRPCIRGLRVTAGTIVGLVAAGYTAADILKAYPYLEMKISMRLLRTRHGVPKRLKYL